MSTVESIQGVAPKRRSRLAGTLIAAGALVALAIAALFLFAFTGKNTTSSAHLATGSQTPYQPAIQYRGTGQPPTSTHLSSGAPPTAGLLKAEHSYGEVP